MAVRGELSHFSGVTNVAKIPEMVAKWLRKPGRDKPDSLKTVPVDLESERTIR